MWWFGALTPITLFLVLVFYESNPDFPGSDFSGSKGEAMFPRRPTIIVSLNWNLK